MTSGKTSSAKVAGCLGLLVLIVALSAGCISVSQKQTICEQYQTPDIGVYVDEDYIITIQEKWRQYESYDDIFGLRMCPTAAGYSYHVRLTSGTEYCVDPEIYASLPVERSGIGCGYPTLHTFNPVNVSHFSDVKGQVIIVP